MRFNHTKIRETPEELRRLTAEATSPYNLTKIRALYLLKTQEVKTITNLATMLEVNRITLHRWFDKYKKGGLKLLLNNKYANGRRRKIPPDAMQALVQRLNHANSGFTTYCDVQTWLEEKYGVNVSYKVVYSTIRYQLNLPIHGNAK